MPQTLFTPGPVPIPSVLIERMSQPIIHHHSQEAKELFGRINSRLQNIFLTQQPVLTVTSSSTGAAEAAVCSLFSTNEKAVVFDNGRFAKRWAQMLRVFGLEVVDAEIEWGQPVTNEFVVETMQKHPDTSCVWLVHSETSTGVLSDIQSLIQSVRSHSNAIVCVDAVSSLCVHEVRMDDWGIDVLLCGSQKGFMLPPGLGFVALSIRAWKKAETCITPRFYFDLQKALKAYEKNSALFTPAISLLFGLDAALDLLLAEGLANVWQRHAQTASFLRSQLDSIGYKCFTHYPSNALSTVMIPESCPDIVAHLRLKYGIQVAEGQDHLQKTMFRIGHIGAYTQEDILGICSALQELSAA